MAMTDAQKHLVFEIFGIPFDTSVLYIDGKWGTGKTTETGAILVSRDLVLARIDALAQAQQDRLSTLLTAWEAVSTSATKLIANVANQGVQRDPARIRALIRERVKMIVPVIREGEARSDGSLPLG